MATANQEQPAAPHTEREGHEEWRAVITGVRNGEPFCEWRSSHTFTTCATALAVAEREFAKRVSA